MEVIAGEDTLDASNELETFLCDAALDALGCDDEDCALGTD